ncbi:jmjC domain-containing histone demethylation protein 1 [Ditylenchus destructor]|uniref:JmjC domain-containing histone demethylation protein 1 n=1 Tax=Ditylenchus destructor TaxID=166010 RepID=A0AAD4NHJ6_9BILA|nr:jmjC domain-containing histone demethylation protein 1 [Ditylenchus destructor]
MNAGQNFDFFEDRYPKRIRKPINKHDTIEESEDDLFEKPKLMSHCVYDIQEIVSSKEFDDDDETIKVIQENEFDPDQFKKSVKNDGLQTPILFKVPPEKLGMKVPDAATFSVFDVLDNVGKSRKIEVVEVNEQKGRSMKLQDFVNYYNTPECRKELLNVLSLEFSLTKLADIVSGPEFVTNIDWIDNVWPQKLKERQIVHIQESGPHTDFSTYPKVQRYCLLSVADCFTDFHVDFGGTSVWYHILKGKKIFWLIEPTEENLLLYEEWILGGNNSESFFGRIVNKCIRAELSPGTTFIIPSGWIHCVYTPEDSLVFGGNFLHSFAVPMQIRVVRSEDRIKVGGKYRFPHFKQMIWYAIENVVRRATGRKYLKPISTDAYLRDLEQHNTSGEQTEPITPMSGGLAPAERLETTAEATHRFDEEENDSAIDSATDDQEEPRCSSAVESGCKKSGQPVKDTFLTGMGMEESESEDEQQPIASTSMVQPTKSTAEEEAEAMKNDPLCYYDNMANGADGCYALVPTQMKFAPCDHPKSKLCEFKPVEQYIQDFIESVSSLELNGYCSMLDYARKLLKTKTPNVGEGITRPRHLLLEFEHLVQRLTDLGKLSITKTVDLSNQGARHQARHASTEFNVARQEESTSLTISAITKMKKMRRKSATKPDSPTKQVKQRIKQTKRSNHANQPPSGPVLVDGLPLATRSNEAGAVAPNTYGYDPQDNAVPLGHKPLPSAYRRGADMSFANPPPQLHLKKKKLSTESESKAKVESSEGEPHTPPLELDLIGKIQEGSNMIMNKAKPTGPKSIIKNSKSQPTRFGHCDDPELAYKSPLQRLQQKQTENATSSASNACETRKFPPHDNMSNRPMGFPYTHQGTPQPAQEKLDPKLSQREGERNNEGFSSQVFSRRESFEQPSQMDRDRKLSNEGTDDQGFSNTGFSYQRFGQTPEHGDRGRDYRGFSNNSSRGDGFGRKSSYEDRNRDNREFSNPDFSNGRNFSQGFSNRGYGNDRFNRDNNNFRRRTYSGQRENQNDRRSWNEGGRRNSGEFRPKNDRPGNRTQSFYSNRGGFEGTSKRGFVDPSSFQQRNRRWDSKASNVPPPGICNPHLVNQSNTQAMFSTSMAFPASSSAGVGMPPPLIYPGMMATPSPGFSMPPLSFSHPFPSVTTKTPVDVPQRSKEQPFEIPLPPADVLPQNEDVLQKAPDEQKKPEPERDEDDMDVDEPEPSGYVSRQGFSGNWPEVIQEDSLPRYSTNKNLNNERVESAESPTQDESQLDGLEALAELSRLTRKMGGEEDEDVDLRKLYNDQSRHNNIGDNSSEAMNEDDEGNVSLRDPNSAINEIFRLTQMFSNE